MQLLHFPIELVLLTLENLDVSSLATFLASSPSLAKTISSVSPRLITTQPTLLHAAAARNYTTLLQHLLTLLPATTLDSRQHTALYRAAEAGALDAVRLLRFKPEPARRFATETPLSVAARNGRTAVVSLLLPSNLGAAPWALVAAAAAGNADIAQLLVPHCYELTPALCAASAAGHVDIIELLLSAGGSADAADIDGSTPLHYACRSGKAGVAQKLLAMQAVRCKVDAQDCHGWTALHWAQFCGEKEVKDMLIAAGADVNVTNDDGRPAGGWGDEDAPDDDFSAWERMFVDVPTPRLAVVV
ncbi:ankyrin repeat-containing domain protein [Sphaerosporella brunnea]|uniref:Ankyrin repeat-containing domain protein n=1 Tax=Sphaerosporella brunnea TaxID=1250544 RepID=A0A5J5F2B9_9PEZI|nr:ankyrin repeat-containing domain protein [Sphaerosporella brunnea]